MAKLNQETINKLKANPHYRPAPGQMIPDWQDQEKEEEVKTFGVPPAVHTVIPKHPTQTKKAIHKKKIDK